MINTNYSGWDTQQHLNAFDFWNGMTNSEFRFKYGAFQEQRYLCKFIKNNTVEDILDVGCATGTTYKYLKSIGESDKIKYTGVDISETAINRAREIHRGVEFSHLELPKIHEFLKKQYDLVISRDTIMHQEKPFEFLSALLGCAQKALIVRLRTRDFGKTVSDSEISCQAHYGEYWMPYIVLNTNELIDAIRKDRRVTRINISRSYQILGGKNGRYLPKELYFRSAFGAETAVMIEFNEIDHNKDIEIIEYKSLEGHDYILSHLMKRIFFRFQRMILKPGT